MEKIQVGEYIRTKDGYIGKCQKIDVYYGDILIRTELKRIINDFEVIKHSSNILDLIEKGDFVKLEYYVAKYKKRITRFFEISKIDGWQFVGFENEHCHFTYDLEKNRWLDGKGYNPKIKSIVTKQQMEAMEYEVK